MAHSGSTGYQGGYGDPTAISNQPIQPNYVQATVAPAYPQYQTSQYAPPVAVAAVPEGKQFQNIDDATMKPDPVYSETNTERFRPTSQYRDVLWAILFIANFAGLIILGIVEGSNASGTSGGVSFGDFAKEITGVMVACVFIAMVVAAIWIAIVKRYARQLITFTLLANMFFLAACGIAMFAMGNVVGGVVFLVMGLITGLFFFFWRKRIPFAAEMLSAVSQLIQKYPQTVAVAFGGVVVGIVYLVFWGWVVSVSVATSHRGTQAFLTLNFYWTTQVIKNVVHVTVSGTVATWYFLQDTAAMPDRPTIGALKRAMTTSFGSICLGSLIVALIKLFRAFVRSFREEGSVWACLVDCLLGLLDRLAQYFNLYAFTQVAICTFFWTVGLMHH